MSLLKRDKITYPVEYKNLRNYLNDGGICYFVIIISDDGEKASIFYNTLTPIKLKYLLKDTREKRPDQTQNIVLTRLKDDDKNGLYRILLQFGHDSKEQGTRELIRQAISLKDMEKIDSIKATAFINDEQDIIQKMESGEVCCFGHLRDADIWLPFDYDILIDMKIVSCIIRNDPVIVDEKVYYENIKMKKGAGDIRSIIFSENLCLDIENHKFMFEPLTELEQIMKDIFFLEAIQDGKTLCVGKTKLCTYNGIIFSDEFQKLINNYKQLQLAINKFEIRFRKRFANFNEENWKAIDELLKIYQGKILPQKEMVYVEMGR